VIQYSLLMLVQAARVTLLLLLTLALAACAGRGGIPRAPFADIPIPPSFIPYSEQWVRIRSQQVDAARMVYMTELDVEGAAAAVRELLLQHEWSHLLTNRARTPDGYPMVVLDFGKAEDTIRATVQAAAYATRVEMTVARIAPR
jgi:hypothetical protein